MILTNSKFWRGIRYFSEAVAQGVLGWAIEMNPWNILNLQVEEAEKDREQLRIHGEKLKAQEASLHLQLEENERNLKQAQAEVKICQAKLQKNPDDFDTQLALETSATNFNNAKDFIDGVKNPLQTT
jgi:chromosome segregation ATPase